jgi:hypothetical protein
LILRVNSENNGTFEATPSIRKVEYDFEEVLDEGYDPSHSPLGCPVYWRIVRRDDEKFYYSTFQVPRDYVLKVWGAKGLSYCDPVTGRAVARIETRLSDDETLSNGVRRDEIGHTPLQYEIIGEGFSLRELMQALKAFEAQRGPAPDDILIAFFGRYICEYLGQRQLTTELPQLIEQ